ncbi:MAG: ATP-dependent helicase HrpB [Crocinitomicaceae bacterium]
MAENNTLVLTAPPGAGKSTLLPLALLDEPWLKGKKILMLEPRRLAAKGIAYRMADLIGESVGETIGYRIRFETKSSDKTRIEIITEGILTRIIQNDNALEDVGLVIFDEFHERSIHADTALALTKETQDILRTDLRILILSATMDTSVLTKNLGAPLVKSDGRQYPVEVIYNEDICPFGQYQPDIGSGVATIVNHILNQNEGDILVFLPGEREIEDCFSVLSKLTSSQSTVIYKLYSRLPQSKQQQAIRRDLQGKRKVVLATTIAETSLTIEGIKVVVDAGFTRVSQFDPKTGLSGLRTIRISIDAADQRAGRAGRLSLGVAYRLWSAATHSKLENHRTPEILEADLTPLMLNLYDWGQTDINALFWLDTPPAQAVKEAKELLEDIEAIAFDKITEHGKAMNQLPTHPRIAHLLLSAREEGLLELATDLAAVLKEKDPLPKEAGIDISLRIEGLRRFRKNNSSGRGNWSRIEKIAKQYRLLMSVEPDNDSFDPNELGLLLVYAFPERVACARPGNKAQFQLTNGAYAAVGHRDDLAHEPWLAVAHLHDRPGGTGKIWLAAPLNPRDLVPFIKVVEMVDWNSKKGGLVAQEEWRMGRIILKTVPIKNPDQEMIQKALI